MQEYKWYISMKLCKKIKLTYEHFYNIAGKPQTLRGLILKRTLEMKCLGITVIDNYINIVIFMKF